MIVCNTRILNAPRTGVGRYTTELLKRLHVMDYSLLVGIHNVRRGNRDNVRSNTLKVFSVRLSLSPF